MTAEGKRDVKVVGCVPGFYYTLYGARGLGALPTTETAYGPELCGLSGEVTFEKVAKPSDAAGFFSVGVKETPGVQPSNRSGRPDTADVQHD